MRGIEARHENHLRLGIRFVFQRKVLFIVRAAFMMAIKICAPSIDHCA